MLARRFVVKYDLRGCPVSAHGRSNTMTDRTLKTFLASHPRAMGILFMTVLLLSQAGTALAGGCLGHHGP